MAIPSVKIRQSNRASVEASDLQNYRAIFSRIIFAQLALFAGCYLFSIYVRSALSLHHQIYAQLLVLISFCVAQDWFFRKLNIPGRLKDAYANHPAPSLITILFMMCIPVLAVRILYLAYFLPRGTNAKPPWWLKGGPGTYGLYLAYSFFVPVLLGFYLSLCGHSEMYKSLKNLSYVAFNPFGYYFIHAGSQVAELRERAVNWKELSEDAFSQEMRSYASAGDLNGVGMILLMKNVASHKSDSARAIASAELAPPASLKKENLIFLASLWSGKTTHLGSFSPLIIISPSAMFEAALVTIVTTVIDLGGQERFLALLEKLALKSEAKDQTKEAPVGQVASPVETLKMKKDNEEWKQSFLYQFFSGN